MKISDAKEGQSRYLKRAMFNFLLSYLHVDEMHGIICELRVAERIKKEQKLYQNDSSNSLDKVASTLCEITAQEAGATTKVVLETFFMTKQQQMH